MSSAKPSLVSLYFRLNDVLRVYFPVRAQQEPLGGGGGSGNRQTGLMVGRGYGIRRVCDVSAEVTHNRDAVSFRLVQVRPTRTVSIGGRSSRLASDLNTNPPRESRLGGM